MGRRLLQSLDTRDSFIGLFLQHTAGNVGGLKHTGAPLFYYKWHGHVWSRALFRVRLFRRARCFDSEMRTLPLLFRSREAPA